MLIKLNTGIYCFQRSGSSSLHFGHHQECYRQSLYCIGGDRDNTASVYLVYYEPSYLEGKSSFLLWLKAIGLYTV